MRYAAFHGCNLWTVVVEVGSGSQRTVERHGFRVTTLAHKGGVICKTRDPVRRVVSLRLGIDLYVSFFFENWVDNLTGAHFANRLARCASEPVGR